MPRLTDTGLRSCTVELSSGKFCTATSAPDMPFPICMRHALDLFLEMTSRTTPGNLRALVNSLGPAGVDPASFPAPETRIVNPVVYYLLIDGLVKIGHTVDLTSRMRAYPPAARIMATEPGERQLEGHRLHQFNEYLAHGREWFAPGQRLLDHINDLPPYDWGV